MKYCFGFQHRVASLLMGVLALLVLFPCSLLAAAAIGPPAPKVAPAVVGPELMNFQGDLRDGAGKALNGTYPMAFRLYDAASGGTLLLTDAHTGVGALVTVSEGLFDTVLGGGTVTPGSQPSLGAVFANLAAVWVEIQVSTETLSPRMQVTSAAYAQNARTLEGKGSAEFAGVTHQHAGVDITSAVAQATTATSAGDSDKLDGQHAASFAGAVHGHAGTDISGSVSTAAYSATAGDSDTVDSQHAASFAGAVHGHAGTDISGPVAQATTATAATTATSAGDSDKLDGQHATAFAGSVHSHDASAISTGTLPVARGGTGLASPGASGNLLTSNGAAWTSSAPPTASALGAVVDAADATLTRSGSGTAVSPYKLALNLSKANTWTGAQTFQTDTFFPSGVWSAAGSLGIGTAYPSARLHLLDGQGLGVFEANQSAYGAALFLKSSAPSAEEFGSIHFIRGNESGAIVYDADQNMEFYADSGLPDMTITSAGNIGVGTNTPGSNLEIVKENAKVSLTSTESVWGTQLKIVNKYASSTVTGEILFEDSSGQLARITCGSTGNLVLQSSGFPGLYLYSGNVGIGEVYPAYRLEVNGDANLGSSAGSNKLFMKEKEAVWFDGDYFSWGYGGTANRFYDPVGIGGLDPAYQLQLSQNSAAKPVSTAWTVPSDIRLKKDIAPFTDGLEVIEKIRPISYRCNGLAGLPADMAGIGVIAQEIRDVAPYTVGTFRAKLAEGDAAKTELYDFNSHALTFVLINAVKELHAEVQALSGKTSSTGKEGRKSNASQAPSASASERPETALREADGPLTTPVAVPAAERLPVCEAVEAGDVLVADPAHPGAFCLGRQAADPKVVGIARGVAAAPADEFGEGYAGPLVPVATYGIVTCKADAAYGPIAAGDLLTTSPTPGHAMKAQPTMLNGLPIFAGGTLIGKTLEALESGTGTIQILVMLR